MMAFAPPHLSQSTSAGQPMTPGRNTTPTVFPWMRTFGYDDPTLLPTTFTSQTTSGTLVIDARHGHANINELRRLSGLTWDQLARLFRINRRSLHFWASGKAMAPTNEEHLQRLLAVIHKIDQGTASINRALLLAAGDNGVIPFDLLATRKYEEAVSLIGAVNTAARAVLPSLSETAKAARMPRAPEEMIGALQDSVHQKNGTIRAAKSLRVKRDR